MELLRSQGSLDSSCCGTGSPARTWCTWATPAEPIRGRSGTTPPAPPRPRRPLCGDSGRRCGEPDLRAGRRLCYRPPQPTGSPTDLSTACLPKLSGCDFGCVDGGLAVHAVPDAADRDDLKGGLVLELLAEPANVHIDGLAIAGELVPPHVFEQNVACVHTTRKCEQVRDEVELACCELDLSTIQRDPARSAVDVEGPDRIVLGNRLGLVRLRLGSPHYRIDAREHLTDREGLGGVVVRAELEPNDLVDLGVFGRDHDDRNAAAPPQRAAEVESAHAGQHQVQQDQVGLGGAIRTKARGAIARFLDRERRGDQVVLEHLADPLVVLDHEHAAGRAVMSSATHPSSTTWPVSRKTMSSATLVTRSAMRSRLCATSRRVTDLSAPSESVLPLPISPTRSSKTRWYRRSTSLSLPATSLAWTWFSSMSASRMSCTCPIASSPIKPNSARSGRSGSPTRVLVMRAMRTA